MSEHTAEKATPGEWLGATSGDVARAVEFAREVVEEWQQPVVVRLDGGRTVNGDGTPNPDGKLLWTVYAAECDHAPRFSRSVCGMCDQQEAWCDKCSAALCGCHISPG